MKKIDYKKNLMKYVVILLCIFFVGGVAIGINSVLEMEGTAQPYVPAQSLSPTPKTSQAMADYVLAAANRAGTELPKVDAGEDTEINDVVFSNATAALSSAAEYIKGAMCESIEQQSGAKSADYGEKNSLPQLLLSVADFTQAAQCTDIYYKCPICGKNVDEQPDACPECAGTQEFLLRYSDEYTFTFNIDPNSHTFETVFPCRTAGEIDAIAAVGCENVCKYENLQVKYTGARLVVKVNRLTDKITSIELFKEVEVSTDLEFIGEYSSAPAQSLMFTIEDKIYYGFSWPQLALSTDTITIEPKKSDSLKAVLTCDDPAKYDAKWASSDESVATVDDEGYVTAGKKTGVVTITAQFEFQGKTYSDSCTVFVRTPVESLDISKRSLSLKPGQTFTLAATVSPRKATVKTVKWYSSDESVATVDENGVVTAVSAGNVKVYAVSDDGYYKATCKLEVTK